MISFKFVNHEDDIRRVRFESFPTFVELQRFAAQLYGYQYVTLKYTDDENDLVTIKSDADLTQALIIKRSMDHGDVFCINVTAARHSTQKHCPQVARAPSVTRTDQVHDGVCCNGCGVSPLQGIRYKCSVCPDFDMCGSCRSTVHHPAHAFWKLDTYDTTTAPSPSVAIRASPPSHHPGGGGDGSSDDMFTDLLTAFADMNTVIGDVNTAVQDVNMAVSDARDAVAASSRRKRDPKKYGAPMQQEHSYSVTYEASSPSPVILSLYVFGLAVVFSALR